MVGNARKDIPNEEHRRNREPSPNAQLQQIHFNKIKDEFYHQYMIMFHSQMHHNNHYYHPYPPQPYMINGGDVEGRAEYYHYYQHSAGFNNDQYVPASPYYDTRSMSPQYASFPGPPNQHNNYLGKRFFEPRLAVWVGNLPNGVSIHQIRDHFKDINIVNVKFITKKSVNNQMSKVIRSCFLNLETEEDVAKVIREFHGTTLNGNDIACRPHRVCFIYSSHLSLSIY